MVEIAVCYADLSVVRVPWDQKETLPRNGLESIAILHPDRPRKGHRPQALIGHDFYILLWSVSDCCLTGHDGDFGHHDLWDAQASIRWQFPFKLPENHIVFETDGALLGADDWIRAQDIFNDQYGEMF